MVGFGVLLTVWGVSRVGCGLGVLGGLRLSVVHLWLADCLFRLFYCGGYDFSDLVEPSDFGLDCGDLDWFAICG